jgi:L-asparaginase II
MSNPILVEATRGALVESHHRGAVAVVDAAGTTVLAMGDTDRPIYPRSAIKALQALPLIESGAADRFGLAEEEIALACASHGGEPQHVRTAKRMLERAGLDEAALACGAHWPSHRASAQALARDGGSPSAFHNNCSGKHAGFLCATVAMNVSTRGYTAASHPIQREIRAVIEQLAGVGLGPEAIDGCSVPTWPLSLSALAGAFAHFATGAGLPPERARAAARLRAACAAKPWHVAGTGRFCTKMMERFGQRVFVKGGAEGMYCGALPEQGYGIAVKCDDGAGRAAEVVMASLVARLLPLDGEDRDFVISLMQPAQRNWNGLAIGELRPSALMQSIAAR